MPGKVRLGIPHGKSLFVPLERISFCHSQLILDTRVRRMLHYTPRENSLLRQSRSGKISNTTPLRTMTEDLPPFPWKSEVGKTTLFKPSFFGGRFTRKQYWIYLLAGGGVVQGVSYMISEPVANFLLLLIAAIFYFIPISVKRAHDIGHGGSFVVVLPVFLLLLWTEFLSRLILIVPCVIYGVILLIRDSQKRTNLYGPSSKYPDTTV